MKIVYKFFLVLFSVASMHVSVYAQNTIKRSSEVIIMTGKQIEDMIGVSPSDIVGFRREGSGWTQIPVQVDERDSVDGNTIYGDTPVEEFLNENWGTDLHKLVILTYTDTATFTGPDKNLLFDENDEFLFMARDAGVRYFGAADPQNTVPGSKVEMRLVDPISKEVGYVYLFEQNGNLDPSAGIKYVDYKYNLLSGNYKETFTIGGKFDPENSFVTTEYYQTHFSDRWIKDGLTIPAKGATANAVNILDRHKTLLEPNNCGRTEVVFSSQEGAFVTNKSGPIRAIRSYFGANSGPLVQREHFFYEQSEEMTFYLRMHSIRGIVDIMDYTNSAIGMKYKNNNNPAWVTFDGIPETINNGKILWEILTGDQGSLITFSSIDHNFNITEISETYYEDNLDPVDIQCTGDSLAIGSVGHLIPIRIPLTDPRGDTDNNFSLSRENYYQQPNLDVSHVFKLEAERNNPVSVCAGDCDLVPISPANLTLVEKTAEAVKIKWQDNSSNETGFVIERDEEQSNVFIEVGEVGTDISTFTDQGLSQSTDYTYRVKAINETFSSSYTNTVSLKTERSNQSSPTELQLTDRTASSITLLWEDNTTSESGFSLERVGPDDNKQFVQIAIIPANQTAYTDRNLIAATQYSYRVAAIVNNVNSQYSNILHTKTASEPPEAPTNLDYQQRGASFIDLIWNDNSSTEDGFIIERARGDDNVVFFQDTVGIGITSYADTGLESNTVYRYKVTSYNEGGKSSSNTLSTKTTGNVPLAPTNLNAGIHSKTRVVLEWTDNAIDETGYIIERSTSENAQQMEVIDSVAQNVTSYENMVNLDLYGYYMYRVKAYNDEGVSAYSNNARTTIVAAIEEETEEFISLYPNPNNGEFSLEFYGELNEDLTVSVLDPLGRLLVYKAHSLREDGRLINLDLQYLSSGSYFVIVESGKYKIVKRLLKLL
jgi:hypothetical protein